MDDWVLELELRNQFGERYQRRIRLTRDCIESGMTPRNMEYLEMGAYVGMAVPGLGFDTVVEMMKKREFRRDVFVQAAKQLAGQMADFMEDKEGWHGVDRAERAAAPPPQQEGPE